VTGHIAVGGRVLLDASFPAARARLAILASGGMLLEASEVAYGEGITGLVKVAGPAAGLTRLAGVRLGHLAETDDCADIALQWEAISADGKLFIALDADLMLVPARPVSITRSLDHSPLDAGPVRVQAGDRIAALALAGGYRPQPSSAGAELDQAVVRHCASAAIRGFLARVAGVLVHPADTAGTCRS
jgi:hypothetical protein